MKRYGDLESAAKTVEDIEGVLHGNDAFQFWLFQKRWPEIAGKTMAEESFISHREGKILFLGVTNSVWMQEIVIRRETLLQKIREDEYGKRFTEIRPIVAKKKREETGGTPGIAKLLKEDTAAASLEEKEIFWIKCWTRDYVEKEELRPVFEQLMENTLRHRKTEIARGWKPCEKCGTLCPPEEKKCAFCRAEEEKEKKGKILRALRENPELLYKDVLMKIPCTYAEFSDARDILIHRYKENYYQGCGTEEEIRRLLSLLTHKPFEEISREEAEKALPALPKKNRKY